MGKPIDWGTYILAPIYFELVGRAPTLGVKYGKSAQRCSEQTTGLDGSIAEIQQGPLFHRAIENKR